MLDSAHDHTTAPPRAKRRVDAVLAVALSFVLAPLSASAQSRRALEHVSVRLDYFPGAQHSFFWLGRDKGWYAEEGIDLEIVPGQGSTVSVKTVASGEDEFALADAASGARGWEVGLPIVYIAIVLRHTPTVIYSLPAKNILRFSDLCGKRVGINLKSVTAEQYDAMIRRTNLACTIERVPVNSGGAKAVASGVVDAGVNFSFTDPVQVRTMTGGAVSVIAARDYFDFLSLGLITNRKLLTEKPDLVHRFVKVTLASLRYTLSHQEEAIATFIKALPNSDVIHESAVFDTFKAEVTADDPEARSLGQQTSAEWAATLSNLREAGIIKTPISAEGRFIPLPE